MQPYLLLLWMLCLIVRFVKVSFQKMANIIPLPKINPPASIHKDIRPLSPLSLTHIAAILFESIAMEWMNDTIVSNVDPKQFGGLAGTTTTDALIEMTHKWYEATDTRNTYARIVLLDFSKAFDLINHNILLDKLQVFGISAPILAAFLLDRTQLVKQEIITRIPVIPMGDSHRELFVDPNASWCI